VKARKLTVAALYRKLGQLISAGHARKPIVVDKTSFKHPLEGYGVTLIHARDVDVEWIRLCDDDGGTALKADGSERGFVAAVIVGPEEREGR